MDRGLGPAPPAGSLGPAPTSSMVPTLVPAPPHFSLLDTFSSAYVIWRLVMYEDGGLDAADPVSHCSGVRAAYAPGASWVIWGYLKNLGSFMPGFMYKSIKKQTSRSDKSEHGR